LHFLPFRCATLSATLAQDGSKKHNVKSIENGNANCTPAKSQERDGALQAPPSLS